MSNDDASEQNAPVDPYKFANQIYSNPAIPDEKKISILGEIGKNLGIDIVGKQITMEQQGLPIKTAVGLIHRTITRYGEEEVRKTGFVKGRNVEREAWIAGMQKEINQKYARQLGELDKTVGRLEETQQRLLDLSNKEK